MIAGPQDIHAAKDRLAGYYMAMGKLGLSVEKKQVYVGNDTIESGTKALETLTEGNPDLTAVIASSYRMTLGAVIGANESGIAIPERISLVGFDNPQFAKAVHPKLTIVNQPMKEMGEHAAGLMLDRLAGEEKRSPEKHILLHAELLEGRSVKQKEETR